MNWFLTPLLVVVVTQSSAATPSPETDKRRARLLYKQGVKAARARRFHEAVRLLKKAYLLWRKPRIQRNLALVYLEMGDLLAAGTHLHRYLRSVPPEVAKHLSRPLHRLRGRVGVLEVRVSGRAVSIRVDGRQVGTGQATQVVLPGLHTVELLQGGRVVGRREFRVSPGQEVLWAPGVDRLASRRAPRPRQQDRPFPRHASGRSRLHWGYFAASASLTVAAAVALTYTGVTALKLEDEYAESPTPELQKRGKQYKLAANVMAGVTGGLAVISVALAVFTRFKSIERPGKVILIPWITPSGGSVSLRFRY